MTSSDPFDIVLVPFPFSDLKTTKKRPALVLARVAHKSAGALLICAMITSQIEGEKIAGDYLIKNWQEAKLLHASKLRLAKLVTIEQKLIQKTLGRLGKADQTGARREFEKVFAKWV